MTSPRVAALRLVTFGVGDGWYAMDVTHVERVLRREGVQSIPGMPPWMEGVVEHHGRIVPVISLRLRFGIDAVERPATSRLLVLSLGEDLLAVSVDRVLDVRAVAPTDVTPPPRLLQGMVGAYLGGMVRHGDAMVLVLDVDRLFGADERVALDRCRDVAPVPSLAIAAVRGADG